MDKKQPIHKKVSTKKKRRNRRENVSIISPRDYQQAKRIHELCEAVLLSYEVEDLMRAREMAEKRAKEGLGWYIV